MILTDAVDLYLNRIEYVEMLSPATIKNRKCGLRYMARYFTGQGITRTSTMTLPMIKRYFAYYGQTGEKSRNTISTMQQHVRTFFRYMHTYEALELGFDPALVKAIGYESTRKVTIPREIITAVLGDIEDIQIRLMVLILFTSGVRISELVRIKAIDLQDRYLDVLGKGRYGGKRRTVYMSEEAARELRAFIMTNNRHEGYVFQRYEEHSNQDNTRHITTETARRWIKPYFTKYGYSFTPHMARHTFAQVLLTEGADVRVIQECLGHSSLTTTTRYLQVPQEHVRDSYDKYMTIKLPL